MATAQSNTLQAQTVDGALNLKAAQFSVRRRHCLHPRRHRQRPHAVGRLQRRQQQRRDGRRSWRPQREPVPAIDQLGLRLHGRRRLLHRLHRRRRVRPPSTRRARPPRPRRSNAQFQQESWGAASEATTDVYQYRAYDVTAATTAAANSATIANEWGYAQLRGRQIASTNVKADTRVTLVQLDRARPPLPPTASATPRWRPMSAPTW